MHGRADDHAHVYQQASGVQVTVEKAYFGYGSSPVSHIDVDQWPMANELDPLELGVHRAAMQHGTAVPPYVERDADRRLREQLSTAVSTGGLVLVLGDSTAGKSRACYEAMQEITPHFRVFVPRAEVELRRLLLEAHLGIPPCVIWLDDLERYVGVDGITDYDLAKLRPMRVIVLATLRAEQYRRLRSTEEPTGSDAVVAMSSIDRMMNQCEPVVLQRRWSSQEIERASTVQDDSRLKAAVEHHRLYGIAEYLAAGPALLREWQLAWGVGANPRGAALVSSAVDLARAGISTAIPLATLEEVHTRYLEDAGGALLRPESMEKAISWATRRHSGVASLLLPGVAPDTYRAFDYLPDAVERQNSSPPIPDWLWEIAAGLAGDNRSMLLSVALAGRYSRPEGAIALLRVAASAGSGDAIVYLARILEMLGEHDEAERWYRTAAKAGGTEAISSLGIFLEGRNREQEALDWLKLAAKSNDAHAAFHVAYLSEAQGNSVEAEEWYRVALRGNDLQAATRLGSLLGRSERYGEAEEVLRDAYEAGVRGAAVELGVVFAMTGRRAEAESLFRRGIECDGETKMALFNLALVLEELGRKNEAAEWYSRGVADGDERAMINLGILYGAEGRTAEAEVLYRRATEAGDSLAKRNLGLFIAREKSTPADMAEAELLLREAVAEGQSAWALFGFLDDRGNSSAAEDVLRSLAEHDDFEAAAILAARLQGRGLLEDAERWLRVALQGESPSVKCELASVLLVLERSDEAIELYQQSVDAGHSHAACAIGSIYYDQGRVEDAEAMFRRAFKSGHKHAAAELAFLLSQVGRFGDAAFWKRRAEGAEGVSTGTTAVRKRRPSRPAVKSKKRRRR